MALKFICFASVLIGFLSCNCQQQSSDNYEIISRVNVVGDKEYRITLNKKNTGIVFFPSQTRLSPGSIYLRMVSDITISHKGDIPEASLHYEEIMQCLKSVLHYMTKECDIKDLHAINVNLESFAEESLNITNTYKDQYGDGNTIYERDVEKVVRESRLISDINQLLAEYGLSVEKVQIEMPFFSYQNTCCTEDNDSVFNREKILKAILYIGIK